MIETIIVDYKCRGKQFYKLTDFFSGLKFLFIKKSSEPASIAEVQEPAAAKNHRFQKDNKIQNEYAQVLVKTFVQNQRASNHIPGDLQLSQEN